MTYIKYSPVDRQFGKLFRDCPDGAPFNGIDPIPGITFGFALESRYPLTDDAAAVYFGTVDGPVEDDLTIGLKVITQAEYDAALAEETAARAAKNAPSPPLAPEISAIALGLTIANGDVQAIARAFNLAGVAYMAPGEYLAFFVDPVPNGTAVISGGGASVLRVTASDEYSLSIEARTSGVLADPGTFNLQVFS